jgi:hypothetical protein
MAAGPAPVGADVTRIVGPDSAAVTAAAVPLICAWVGRTCGAGDAAALDAA